MFNLKRIFLLRIVIILEVIFFLFYVTSISRDYQDGWILEGLELPYIVFAITTVTYFFIEKKFNWMILFTVIIRTTFLMIPSLKYLWFQGIEIDQHSQYRLALDTLNEGHVPQGYLYSQTPLFSLSLAILSMFSGISMLESHKFFPLMLWSTYPIWIYLTMKKLNINSSVHKYALFFSSIPMRSTVSYLTTGTLFGVFFLFLILVQFLNKIISMNRNYYIISLILTLMIINGHPVSSMILVTTLIFIYFIFNNFMHAHKTPFFSIIPISLIIIAFFSNVATKMFKESIIFFVSHIAKIFNIPISRAYPGFIAQRLWEISFVDRIRIFLVYYGADLFIIFLMMISLIFIFKDKTLIRKRGLIFLSFYSMVILSLLLFGLFLNLSTSWGGRIVAYSWLFAPIFISIIFYRIKYKLQRNIVQITVISLFIFFSTVELYRCQPLIPSADSLGENFPADIPLVYVNQVNTAYKRYLIDYASQNIPSYTTIATDKGTGNQIIGMANDFMSDRRVIYPLWWELQAFEKFSYYFITFPGISGKIMEQAQYRTKSYVLSIIYDSKYNIIYSNAETYILAVVMS